MAKGRRIALVSKSIAAALSAIEIYNKPSFPYREENFAILMINAWELLLKARILHLNENSIKSILVMEHSENKDGTKSKLKHPKLNRSGNMMTIGLRKAIEILRNPPDKLPDEVAENIVLLEEIRDNAVHFHNHHMGVAAKIQEVGTASLKNYVQLATAWFGCDFAKYNFFLMPMSFQHEADVIASFSTNKVNKQVGNLLSYFATVQRRFPSDEQREYNIALRIETRFVKTASPDALKMQFTKDATAPKVTITEEEALKRFPLGYDDLTAQLKTRYSDFKCNQEYHKRRKELEKQQRLCRIRLLDPDNPKSPKKAFYSTEIIKEFDKLYAKKNLRTSS